MRRLRLGHGALSFNRQHESRRLATDERLNTLVNVNVDAEIGPTDVVAEEPAFPRLLERHVQAPDGDTVIGPGVNYRFGRLDGVGPNEESFDHLMRATFHDTTVHVGSRVPLIAIDHDVARTQIIGGRIGGFLPFMAGDESTPTLTAQA